MTRLLKDPSLKLPAMTKFEFWRKLCSKIALRENMHRTIRTLALLKNKIDFKGCETCENWDSTSKLQQNVLIKNAHCPLLFHQNWILTNLLHVAHILIPLPPVMWFVVKCFSDLFTSRLHFYMTNLKKTLHNYPN